MREDGEALHGLVRTLHFIGEETEAQKGEAFQSRQRDVVGGLLAPNLGLAPDPAGWAGRTSRHPRGPWRGPSTILKPKYLHAVNLSPLNYVTLGKVYPCSYLSPRQLRVRELLGLSKASC